MQVNAGNDSIKPWQRRASPLARAAAAAYCVLVIYASLSPWSGWRDLGVAPWAYLAAAWPAYITRFDVVANALAYAPLGALLVLALHPRLRGAGAAVVATLAGCVLSGSIEALQTYLPRRVPSIVDLLTNSGGALLGAGLTVPFASQLVDRGRLTQLRAQWFARDASVPLVLLALWPAAQIFPTAMLFGNGGWQALTELAAEQSWAAALGLPQIDAWGPAEFVLAETVVTTTSVLAAGLAAAVIIEPRAPRLWLLGAWIAAACATKMFTYAIAFAPEHAFAWLTPGGMIGLLLGSLTLIAASFGPRRVVSALALVATAMLLVAISLVPENPYFIASTALWRPGRMTHFNALADWLSTAWPWLLLLWLVVTQFTRRRD